MIVLQRVNKLHLVGLGLILACCIFDATSSTAQQFEFNGKRAKNRISFNLIKNLIIIPLFINDTGPFNFILDTGVSPLIITDPKIIEGLNLKMLRPTKISGLGKGPEIDALITSELSARVGKATIKNIPTAILEDDILGLSNYLGVKIHGLIGYYFFKSFLVSINYPSKTLLFQLGSKKPKIKGDKIPIELIYNKPYTTIETVINGLGTLQTKVIVDNGAGHAISLETYRDNPFPTPEPSFEANLGNGLSGPISGKIGRIASLKIGSYQLNNVVSSFPVYDDAMAKTYLSNRNGNLGADVLSRFNITFDYENGLMYIRKNPNFKLPFEHDMSGLEIFADNTDTKRFFVVRIEPGSPGEQAGIQTDDEILAINFVDTKRMELGEITKLFRQQDGKTIFLTLNRHGELIYKLIKLKRRI
ncbi:aspartyl protease family protein [Pedobacter sp. PWIIR3]